MIPRWVSLVSCLILALLMQIGAATKSEDQLKIEPKTLELDDQPVALFYFEGTETALTHLSDGELYRSFDGGKEWEVVETEGAVVGPVAMIRQHPFDNNKAYALSINGRHWITTDQAKTWKSFEVADTPASYFSPLVFHGWNSSKVILQSDECAGRYCIVRSYYTTDDFKSVKLLREGTGGCIWAAGDPQFSDNPETRNEIEDRSLCVVTGLKIPLPHAYRLVYSDTYFKDGDGTEVKLQEGRTVSGVQSIVATGKFLLAAAKSKGTEELALYVTTDANSWHRAEFDDHRIEEDAYTVLDGTNHSLQVDVLTSKSSEMGVLFTSNSNGTYFTRNLEHTNRKKTRVDFQRIVGIEGIMLVNTVKNSDDVSSGLQEKQVVSKVTFDDGRTFKPLKAGKEDLHLHSVTTTKNVGRFFSSTTAPGLVAGIGNTGSYLKDLKDGDFYISNDAGVTWKLALNGPHKYKFADQGAIVAAIEDGDQTDSIQFSFNHGKDWKTAKLEHKIRPGAIAAAPSPVSLKFIVIGELDGGKTGKHVIYTFDLKDIHKRTCEEGDFDTKWPARFNETGESNCVMGSRQYFKRRKADADCFVDGKPEDFEAFFEPCKCGIEDFECEYKHDKDGEGCILPSLSPPAGECKDPSDTYMAPSGWRLIPGNACNRDGGKNLDEKIQKSCKGTENKPPSGVVEPTKSRFDQSYGAYYYLERQPTNRGDDEAIVMLTKDATLYISVDHGKEWQQPTRVKGKKIITIIPHPYNSEAAFFLTSGSEGFYTVNRGQSFEVFEAPIPPVKNNQLPILTFHPQYPDRLIWMGGVDCPSINCHSDAYYSDNRGHDWKLLLRYAKKCEFGSRENLPESMNLIFCEQHKDESAANKQIQLLSSDDFFTSRPEEVFDLVYDYALMSEFIIVASPDPNNPQSLAASVSVDGKTFAGVKFPPNVQVPEKKAYTVLDSSGHAVFLHVTVGNVDGGRYGSIIKSNSNGTTYVLSLASVSQSDEGYVDFEKIQGMEGVALANIVSNTDAVSKGASKAIKTMITHNDGAQWALLTPPSKDAQGKPYECSTKGIEECSLNLHGYTEREDERDTLSSGSAIGLMMGMGNVGSQLGGKEDADTFLTTDGGFTWKFVRKGKHIYEFGDAGSVIAIVPNFNTTKVLYYSTDEGDSWEEFAFSDVDMYIDDISTVPSDTSKKFLLWGRHTDSSDLVTVNVDFSGLRDRSCSLDETKENDDYYLWEPKHPFQEDNCLFGHVEQYHRKKTSAQCWNGWKEPHVHSIGNNCSCTRADFEW